MTQSTTTQPPTLPLNPALLPDAPSWWPLAWGWWSLMALACFTVLLVVIYLRWRKKKLAPKKAALKIITNQALEHTPSAAIELFASSGSQLLPKRAYCYAVWRRVVRIFGLSNKPTSLYPK